MFRPVHVLILSCLAVLACLATAPLAGGAFAAQASSDKPDDAAKKAALAEAINTCDRGASVPLDPEAKAPPVQYGALFPFDMNLSKLKDLADKCQAAMLGAPQEKRLTLQWLRVEVALDQPGLTLLLPQVKLLADGGSPEANFLLYEFYSVHRRDSADAGAPPVTRAMALDALQKAGTAGHLTALLTLLRQYTDGPLLRRDARKLVETAQRVIDAPVQGQSPGEWDSQFRAAMPLSIARTTLTADGFTSDEQKKAFHAVETDSQAGTNGSGRSALAYIKALRLGRGTQQDAAKARQLLEARAGQDDDAIPMLADMLAKGEGGPVDGKRAIALLRPVTKNVAEARPMLAGLLLDGKFVGRQPRAAIQLLNAPWDLDAGIRLADLLLDYDGVRVDYPDLLVERLSDGADAGEPGAALALARLQLSDDQQFKSEDQARAMLKPLADGGDRDALWLYASTQYANLDSTSYRPSRREDGLSDDQLKALIDQGQAKKEPQAYLLQAKLLRRGVVYPQDDAKATAMLINAANLGSVEAMVLLGDAYDNGLGVDKSPRERLRAWREAARLGSLKAKSKLANAFTFDSFDRLMTLREGITDRIALYNDGVGRMGAGVFGGGADIELSGLFSGPASSAGTAAVAAAVMDAFREAPAGLEEENLVGIGKALPEEIRVAIETTLKNEGFYAGDPKGYFGPDARKALADWVDAKGPLADAPGPQAAGAQQAAPATDLLAGEILNRVRDKVFTQAQAAKTEKQKLAAIKQLDMLARYGDLPSRWALVRNYHQAKAIRAIVTPDQVTRYALDLLVSKPDGVDKPEFEFIFDLTQIAKERKSRAVGSATLQAIRDDPRLQDPLTLGAIMEQFAYAPDACGSVLDAARNAGVARIGADGCDEETRSALIAYAKAKGASGTDAAARKAAAEEIKTLDAQAAK
ncbi:tetratricopeptide repeat protein [Mesorhizobium sp.]|uniref:tetratricopeptide repeat protein n=1 Tax=Mesorhizobium sp. TaxID=1871066 RepID=UPI000FE41D3D|nr:sel1 repeat family protein [Mesorhizobium sp.]RWG76878.1 MAG: sel1 repeat family protein [Mesorhizobium sp.]RWG77741.1 MAG: sel1 repeat family protein [Mesorhizobium sp.]RWK02193.1 MAG: sel1 repeat family protein [Mesorhizobium sp.]RWK02895.1 MAG: sel1 repeat family protein [Mesorhizobium sp.]RWK13647.1 MAG: sel1 repeat family protein [Mesorhizobium sp.]